MKNDKLKNKYTDNQSNYFQETVIQNFKVLFYYVEKIKNYFFNRLFICSGYF